MAESIRAFASRDPSFVAVERAVSTMRETLARMIGRMWKATDADDNPDDIFQATRRKAFLALHDDSLEVYVFATDKNLDVLTDQKHWFCDGTFDIVPNGHQLYTLHVIANGSRSVPVVYFMARKKN